MGYKYVPELLASTVFIYLYKYDTVQYSFHTCFQLQVVDGSLFLRSIFVPCLVGIATDGREVSNNRR